MGRCAILIPAAVVLALYAAVAAGQDQPEAEAQPPPAPPTDLIAADHAWDAGDKIDLSWALSLDDRLLTAEDREANIPKPVRYLVMMSGGPYGPFEDIARIEPDEDAFERGRMKYTVENLVREEPIYFQVVALGPDGEESAPARLAQALEPRRQWFDGGRLWMAIITIILCGSVVAFIQLARSGRPLKVRKIAGLEAVDEAVGRATEMGRSILFIPGIQDMNDIQTVAGLTVLARVARTAAEYDAKVEVPTSRSLVMTTARETVQAAYLSAGRPDAFNENLIYYVTDEQFGYVAYLSGMMVRTKPAACFYMGSFFAESLILAETGNSIGAIQIAGTAQPAQLPFFVAACDYTLIGEEFFAASAYLSGEPDQLGSLKGQDVGKLVVAVLLLFGCILATLAVLLGAESGLGERFQNMVEFMKDTMLV